MSEEAQERKTEDENTVQVELNPEEAFGKPITIEPGKKLRIVIKQPGSPISR
jgi:hypothetical protein